MSESAIPPKPNAKLRVLLVDDCELLAAKLRQLLEVLGRVETVGVGRNGIEALELSRTLEPDLVLMDVQMPEMNGIEAARALKTAAPKTKVLLMSASGSGEMLQGIGLERLDFAPKAELPRLLPLLIEKYLEGKSIED